MKKNVQMFSKILSGLKDYTAVTGPLKNADCFSTVRTKEIIDEDTINKLKEISELKGFVRDPEYLPNDRVLEYKYTFFIPLSDRD